MDLCFLIFFKKHRFILAEHLCFEKLFNLHRWILYLPSVFFLSSSKTQTQSGWASVFWTIIQFPQINTKLSICVFLFLFINTDSVWLGICVFNNFTIFTDEYLVLHLCSYYYSQKHRFNLKCHLCFLPLFIFHRKIESARR